MSTSDDFTNIISELKKGEKQKPTLESKEKPAEIKEEKKQVEKKPSFDLGAPKPQSQVQSKTEQPFVVKPQEKSNPFPIGEKASTIAQPAEQKPIQRQIPKPSKFDVEEDQTIGKEVWTIFGHKGHGKTTAALSVDGEKVVLSFDRKATPIKQNFYGGDPKIHIYDAIKYMDYSNQQSITESSDITFDYIMAILEKVKEIKPDWIIIDGAELFSQICEWKMRYANQINAFEGFKNFNLWKERRTVMREVHNKMYEVANKGIMYTTYIEKDEVVVRGEVVAKKDVPKWIDVMLTETDYVIKVEHDFLSGQFVVEVVSSKNDKKMKTGQKFVVTGKKFWDELSQKIKSTTPEITTL